MYHAFCTVYYLDQTHNSMSMPSSVLIIPAHRKLQTYSKSITCLP